MSRSYRSGDAVSGSMSTVSAGSGSGGGAAGSHNNSSSNNVNNNNNNNRDGSSSSHPSSYPRHTKDGPLSLIELKDHFKRHNRVKEYQGHAAKVHSVDWSCDGRRLASGSFDKSVCVFLLDGTKLRQEHIFRGHTDSVDQLCWHATNADLLGTASGDKTVRIWDARTSKSVDTVQTKGENINISWSPDGNSIAVGNKEDLITFIDVRTGKISQEVPFKFEVNEICWNPSSDLFFLTTGEGSIHIYSYPDMQVQQVLKAHPANCICIEFHPKGEYFAVGSADAVVSLWDHQELACVRTFTRLDWPVRAISFNHDGTLIASASEDLTIDIAHVDTGEQVAEIGVETPTFTVSFHPSKNLLAFACDDKDRDRDTGSLKLYGLPSD